MKSYLHCWLRKYSSKLHILNSSLLSKNCTSFFSDDDKKEFLFQDERKFMQFFGNKLSVNLKHSWLFKYICVIFYQNKSFPNSFFKVVHYGSMRLTDC